jgi:hypothetical protein
MICGLVRGFVAILALAAFLFAASPTRASSGQNGGGKTSRVEEYTKKVGTTVAAHDRKAPEPHATATKAEKPKHESTSDGRQ